MWACLHVYTINLINCFPHARKFWEDWENIEIIIISHCEPVYTYLNLFKILNIIYSISQKFITTNYFIMSQSWNRADVNKSWFTVTNQYVMSHWILGFFWLRTCLLVWSVDKDSAGRHQGYPPWHLRKIQQHTARIGFPLYCDHRTETKGDIKQHSQIRPYWKVTNLYSMSFMNQHFHCNMTSIWPWNFMNNLNFTNQLAWPSKVSSK